MESHRRFSALDPVEATKCVPKNKTKLVPCIGQGQSATLLVLRPRLSLTLAVTVTLYTKWIEAWALGLAMATCRMLVKTWLSALVLERLRVTILRSDIIRWKGKSLMIAQRNKYHICE